MYHYYVAYGFTLRSDVFLPELQPLASFPAHFDLDISFKTPPPVDGDFTWHRHPRFVSRRPQDRSGETWLRIFERSDGGWVRLIYGDGVEFTLDPAVRHLWVRSPSDLNINYIDSYLVNQGLGFVMRLREQTCLHASAIVVDGEAILISAPSGYGKSTLATHFALQGYPILADDISALHLNGDRVCVHPGYPRLRLTPETAAALFGEENDLTLMAPGWDKVYLPLNTSAYQFADKAVPVRAVYLLRDWADEVSIRPIGGDDAIKRLMANTYLNYLIDPIIQMVDLFVLRRLVMTSAIRELESCSDLLRLSDTVRSILVDLNT